MADQKKDVRTCQASAAELPCCLFLTRQTAKDDAVPQFGLGD